MGNNPVQRPLPDDPTGYYKELRSGFNTSWTLRNLNKSMETICVYDGLAAYVLTRESADFLVGFHSTVTMARGFDGIYIDMLTDNWWVSAELPHALDGIAFDADGNGKSSSFSMKTMFFMESHTRTHTRTRACSRR